MASEQEMREYLAAKALPHNQKLNQLTRVYNNIKLQEAMGLTPSIKQAYGKEKLPFKYQEREGSRLATFTAFFTIDQIRSFVKRSTMQNFTFRIYGVPFEDSPKRKQQRMVDFSSPVWLSLGPVNRQFLEYALDNSEGLTELFNELGNAEQGQQWHSVYEVIILDTRSIRP